MPKTVYEIILLMRNKFTIKDIRNECQKYGFSMCGIDYLINEFCRDGVLVDNMKDYEKGASMFCDMRNLETNGVYHFVSKNKEVSLKSIKNFIGRNEFLIDDSKLLKMMKFFVDNGYLFYNKQTKKFSISLDNKPEFFEHDATL